MVATAVSENGAPRAAEAEMFPDIENGPQPHVPASSSFTGSQWVLIIVLGIINVCAAMIYSIQAPFYPAEAESKNCTATEYGLVFGSYELTVFIACPIIGSFMYRLGSQLAYYSGTLLSGTSVILFGFLPYLDDHVAFLASSFALRISEAIGASAVFIATSTIVTMQFPNSVATVFATLEFTFGCGFALGPTVGSAIFTLGGFTLPFVMLGGTMLLLCIMACFILPKAFTNSAATTATATATATALPGNYNSINNNNSVTISPAPDGAIPQAAVRPGSYQFLDLLKFTNINLYSFSNFVAALGVGFLTATLEPQIRKYKLHKVMTGVIFFLYGGVYAFTAPFVGRLCDRIAKPIYVTLAGAICGLAGFILLGPAPFLGIKSLLWITIVSLVLIGLSLSGIYVSTFLLTLQEAKRHGFPDTPTTSSIVSALWMSCISLGGFTGPTVAGFLVDHYGFRHATYFAQAMNSLVIIFIFIHLFAQRCCRVVDVPTDFIDDENRSLLVNSNENARR